jgi:large subunit ribosomal protein L24
MPRHVRKGDTVMVIAGDAKGRTARVLRVMPGEDKVIVQGINVHHRQVKPNQRQPRGGTISKEMPIHISNVLPVVDGKATRVRFQTRDNGSKVRVAARNGEQIGPELKKAR